MTEDAVTWESGRRKSALEKVVRVDELREWVMRPRAELDAGRREREV